MKYTPIILALSLLLTACSRHDAKLTKKISGTWNGDTNAVMAMSPDGGFSQTLYTDGRPIVFEGTWQVTNNFLNLTITNEIQKDGKLNVPTHIVRRFEVVHVDDHQFVYGSKGDTITLTR
jgi:hypothetical protein